MAWLAQWLHIINGVRATNSQFNDVIYFRGSIATVHACLAPYPEARFAQLTPLCRIASSAFLFVCHLLNTSIGPTHDGLYLMAAPTASLMRHVGSSVCRDVCSDPIAYG